MSEQTYGLTCHDLNFGHKPVPIAREDFEAVTRGTVVLATALAIEEKLDIALENHAALAGC